MVGAERLRELIASWRQYAWAVTDEQVHAVAVVGSYAAGRPRMSSDLDLVIVASAPMRLLPDIDCVSAAVGVLRRSGSGTGAACGSEVSDPDRAGHRLGIVALSGSGRQLILEPHASCETAVRSSLIRRA